MIVQCPTETIRCQATQPIACAQPSVLVRCPSGPICGDPGRPPIEQPLPPGVGQSADWESGGELYDPAGEWDAYDPYAYYYGDDSGCCGT